MIVPDASLVVELLLNSPVAEVIKEEWRDRDEVFVAPHLLDIEVFGALRRLVAGKRVDAYRCQEFMSALSEFPVQRYAHQPLLPRIWELRQNFTVYDAAYIALAEATGGVLWTCDGKLTAGHRARVILVKT